MTPEEFARKAEAQPFAAMLEPLMHKITLVVLREAQLNTPVKTGHLRRSETTRVEKGGLRGYVGSNVNYAPFVHERVPFFSDAIEASRDEIERLLLEAGSEYFESLT